MLMSPQPGNSVTHFEHVLYESRAIRVRNGEFKVPPLPFLHALANGSVDSKFFDATDMVNAVTTGFLKPQGSENVALWRYFGYKDTYVISHHLQADAYKKWVTFYFNCVEKPFESAADVVLEIIPRIRLHDLLVPCHREEYQPFGSGEDIPLPHEDCWKQCFIQQFGRGAGSQFSTKKHVGMPDFVCEYAGRDIILELTLTDRNVRDHTDRFASSEKGMVAYQPTVKEGFTSLRGLVVIGTQLKKVKRDMEKAQRQLDESGITDVQILGLCPVSGYCHMLFIHITDAVANDYSLHEIECNSVPQRIVNGDVVIGHTFGNAC